MYQVTKTRLSELLNQTCQEVLVQALQNKGQKEGCDRVEKQGNWKVSVLPDHS